MIPVARPYLPDRQKLNRYIDGIYERQWLTNNGELVRELTRRLEAYLGVEHLLLVANGTLALQVAYRALGVSDANAEKHPAAVTTPFSFIATASSLKWDGVEPVFVDIDPDTWCIDPDKISGALTQQTRAIVPVHVFGNACDVEHIENIATRHDLKVIYDGSHAFGVNVNERSLLTYGDAATLSFHATKLFHTGEGGAIVFRRKEDLERAKRMINFGITGPESIEELGINAKMSEFQAAMGLCVLDEIGENLKAREEVVREYAKWLPDEIQRQSIHRSATDNFAYVPILMKSEKESVQLVSRLKEEGILARRYFYPSLERLDIGWSSKPLPVSGNIASRIVCLPIYAGLPVSVIKRISEIVSEVFNR